MRRRHHHHHHDHHTADATCAECPAGTMPLSMAPCDRCMRLVGIEGGKKLRKRLAELGLNPGCELRVVHGNGSGPMILAVKDDCRMALGRGMAHKILVEELSKV